METLQQKVQHMKLVVDSNRIFAALIRDSVSRKILLSPKFSFLGVYFSQAEIKKHEKEILSKAGITRRDYPAIFDMFFRKIRLFDETEISAVYLRGALEIMREIDEADTPFLALAMQEKCAIWSDDLHFSRQGKVKILSTQELQRLL